MLKPLSITITATVFLFAVTSMAQTPKVVVIPLNSKRTTCTAPDEVLSLGKCWKDRNLGATQVATSLTDTAAYGDLYQWGRLGDGHQYSTSLTNGLNSANDVPRHSDFILETNNPDDWREPQNDNLWQGLNGINNPCPQGFRLPTSEEWNAERLSWDSQNAAGAFNSPLKLVLPGVRNYSVGTLYLEDVTGRYWSSSTNGTYSRRLAIESSNASMDSASRAYGYSVRCLKN